MELARITFEQAVTLKAKGYNEPTGRGYIQAPGAPSAQELEWGTDNYNREDPTNKNKTWSAPTLYEVCDWARRAKNRHLVITAMGDDLWTAAIQELPAGNCLKITTAYYGYDVALSTGIDKLLQTI